MLCPITEFLSISAPRKQTENFRFVRILHDSCCNDSKFILYFQADFHHGTEAIYAFFRNGEHFQINKSLEETEKRSRRLTRQGLRTLGTTERNARTA